MSEFVRKVSEYEKNVQRVNEFWKCSLFAGEWERPPEVSSHGFKAVSIVCFSRLFWGLVEDTHSGESTFPRIRDLPGD